ncbi:Antitoxin VbhA domain-containing protein [Methylorubrum thiocyanatum]
MSPVELQATAARIQAAWESGRICPLVGRGLHARVLRAGRLVRAGMLSPAKSTAVAVEAENVALAFAPLPTPPLDD